MTKVIEHSSIEGDRWDLLAWRYYGDPLAYEPIVAANVHVPLLPVLPGGLTINIPLAAATTATSTNKDLPPWMR